MKPQASFPGGGSQIRLFNLLVLPETIGGTIQRGFVSLTGSVGNTPAPVGGGNNSEGPLILVIH